MSPKLTSVLSRLARSSHRRRHRKSSCYPNPNLKIVSSSFSIHLEAVLRTVVIRRFVSSRYSLIAHSDLILCWVQGARRHSPQLVPLLLSAPNLSSPSNGAGNVSTTPTFSWSGVNGANRYWLTV